MSGELRSPVEVDYFALLNGSGQYWNGSAFEDGEAGSWADYVIDANQATDLQLWLGDLPGGVAAGVYEVCGYQQAGGSPDPDDVFVGSDRIDTRDPTVSFTVSGSAMMTGFAAASGLSSTDDFYNGSVVAFTSGSLKGISRRVTDYVGSTRTFTFAVALPAAPSVGDRGFILGRIDS